MKKIIKVILISSLFYHTTYTFNTLKEIQNYAKAYPEQIKSDNKDWVDPEYPTFLKKYFTKTWLQKLFSRFSKKPTWDPYKFKKLIKKATQDRINKKYKDPSTKTLELKKGNQLIVFGDLHGAFHSMSRNLTELKNNLNLMNEDLTLKSKDVYLLIIGDAISRNPYSIELLTIIISLMDKNPEQVFYLQGNHEKNKYWQNFSMERELKIKAQDLLGKNGQAPLTNEINDFFNTLPIYLIVKQKDQSFICTHDKATKKQLNNPNLKFIILGEKRNEVVAEAKGSGFLNYPNSFLGYKNGVARWSFLSAPTTVYQEFFNFKDDSFVEISVNDTIETSLLVLHHHNIKNDKTYHTIYYDPIFGLKLTDKAPISNKKNIVKVGSSMFLSGVNWDLGSEIKKGLEMALYKFNAQKTDNLIKPYIFDDNYNPRIALSNVKKLYDIYHIDKLLLPTGTATLAIYQDMIQSGKLAAFFPRSGSRRFRKEDVKNMVHFRPSYAEESIRLIQFLVKEYGIRRFAFFYQQEGESMIRVIQEELKKHGITEWLDLPHIATQEDFKQLADKVKQFTPDAIGCFSAQYPTQKFIRTVGTEFFLQHLLFTPPSLYTKNFKKFLNDIGIRYVISSIVPEPNKSELEIAKEHVKVMAERGIKATIHSFVGYLAASLFTDAIDKVKPPITKEKLIEYFMGLKNYNLKGINVTFDPKTKNLIHDVWIKKLDNTWIKY